MGRLRQSEGPEVQPFSQLQTEGPSRQAAPPVPQMQPQVQQPQVSAQQQDAQRAQTLSQNLDRVGQSISRQSENLDTSLPLTQRAGQEKVRQIEEGAQKIEAERPAEAAEIRKSGEMAKDELAEARKAGTPGEKEKHTEAARGHLSAALEKADAVARLDHAIAELKDAGAPSEIIGTMKTLSVKPSIAKDLSSYARSAAEGLKSAPASDRAAMGSIYSRGLLALKAGKKVEADLHSSLAKAYPKASLADKKKIDDASSSSSKGRMSAAEVMALISAMRTGPSGAGIPPGKIRERLMALQKKIIELSGSGRSGDASKISALVSPATRYIASAEEARRTGNDAKAAEYEELALRHLNEAEVLAKELEAKASAGAAAPKMAKPSGEAAGPAIAGPVRPSEPAHAVETHAAAPGETGTAREETAPLEGLSMSPVAGLIASGIELEDPAGRKALETISESLASGKMTDSEALKALGSFYGPRIKASMKHFEKADPKALENLMAAIMPLSGDPTLAEAALGAAVSNLAEIYGPEEGKRAEIESLLWGMSEGKIPPAFAFSYLSLHDKREEFEAVSKKIRHDEARCGPEFVMMLADSALAKLARGEDPARELAILEAGAGLLPEMETAFSRFAGKDDKSAAGRAALEDIYLSAQDSLAAGLDEKAKTLFSAGSLYSRAGTADLKDFVSSVASKLSKDELSPASASVLLGFGMEMADSEDSISKSGLSLEKKGEALLNLRAYFGMGSSFYEKGDRVGAEYAATLGKLYLSAVLSGDAKAEELAKSVLGDFSSSEAATFGKTFGLKGADWSGVRPSAGAPGWLAASSDSSFSDELSRAERSLAGLDGEIAESRTGIAILAMTSKADAVDEPALAEKYAKALGPEGESAYDELKRGVMRAFSLAGEGATMEREAASMVLESAGLMKEGKDADAKKLLEDAAAKRSCGELVTALTGRLMDVYAAKKDSVLNVHTPSRKSGRAELDHAGEIYAAVAEKLAGGEAGPEDIARIAEADALFKAGLEKIAYEKALGKALAKETASLKKIEARHAELKAAWKDEKVTFPYEWEEVEKDLKKAAHYLKKGDLAKGGLARAKASAKAELYSEKAELLKAYPKTGSEVHELSKLLSSLDEGIAKADKGDFKGAKARLTEARTARSVGAAKSVYEGMIRDDDHDIETLSHLEATLDGYGISKEGEPPKSEAYLDAMNLVLDPLRDSIGKEKEKINLDAEGATAKRDAIKAPADVDKGKIEEDLLKHAARRKDFESFMTGSSFALDMGERGAHYIDLSAKMGKTSGGIWDDALAAAAGEYLRLGKGAAFAPGAVKKALDEGKALYLPEIRHTVKGDEHAPDRFVTLPAAELKVDDALKAATGRVLAVGEGKSLDTWNPALSGEVAASDAMLTIAETFRLGKDAGGDLREIKVTKEEGAYLSELKRSTDMARGWHFGYISMSSTLSLDDRKKGFSASADLSKYVAGKAASFITTVASRAEAPKESSMDSELKELAVKTAVTKALVAGAVATAAEDERLASTVKSAAELFTVNLASAATGGLAAPMYYAAKSGLSIGEAELSGEWDEMGPGSKALMWAGLGLSVAGLGLAGTGAVVSGFGKEAVAASSLLSGVDKAVRYGGFGLLAGGIALGGIELHHTVESGGRWYEVGFILFSNVAPHIGTASALIIPKSKFAGFGHSVGGRFLTSLLTGSHPEEAESMVWREHDDVRYKRYLELSDSRKDAYHAVEVVLGRELSPEEGLSVIEKIKGSPPDLFAEKAPESAADMKTLELVAAEKRRGLAKSIAYDLGLSGLPDMVAGTPDVVPPLRSAEEKKRLEELSRLEAAAGAKEAGPDEKASYKKAVADEVGALRKKTEEPPKPFTTGPETFEPVSKPEKFAADIEAKYAATPSAGTPTEPPGGSGAAPPAPPPPPSGPAPMDPAAKHEAFAADVVAKYELGNPEKLRDFVGRLVKNDPEALRTMESFADRPEMKVVSEMFAEAKEKRLFKTAPDRFIRGDLLKIAEKYAPRIGREGPGRASPEAMGVKPYAEIAESIPPAPMEGSLGKTMESILKKRDAGELPTPEEMVLVIKFDSLIEKGMRKDAAIAYLDEDRVRPHKVPLSSADPDSFKGADASIYKKKVPIFEDGMMKEVSFEDAPRVRLDEAIDLDLSGVETGSSARVYKAEMMVDGKPKEVAVKLFKKASDEKFVHMLSEISSMGELGTAAGFEGFAPKCYGVVNVDGSFGYAMDHVPGKPIDLSMISAEEVRRYVSPKTYEKLERMYRALLDANYDVGDFQFAVLTENAVINGVTKEPGDVVMWDFPKDPKKMTMTGPERSAKLAEKLASVKGSADRILVEGTIAAGTLDYKALEDISRGAMSLELSRKTGSAMAPERVRDPVKQFLLLGPEKRAALAKEWLDKINSADPASAGKLSADLKRVESLTGVRLVE